MLLKDGTEGSNGIPAVFLSAPFCFCPNCRVTYSPRQRKDFGKLATLSAAEGQGVNPLLPMFRPEQLRLQSHPPIRAVAESGVDGVSLADELVKTESEWAVPANWVWLAIVAMEAPPHGSKGGLMVQSLSWQRIY